MGRFRTPRKPGTPYITAEGKQQLQRELKSLWREQRPVVTQAVSEAAAQGDRSENAEYIYGKKQLRQIDARIRFLSKRLESLKVVDNLPTNQQQVYFGAWVTVRRSDGEEQRLRIIGPDEIDTQRGLISIDSPVARAMLGKKVGDQFRVSGVSRGRDYEIREISYSN